MCRPSDDSSLFCIIGVFKLETVERNRQSAHYDPHEVKHEDRIIVKFRLLEGYMLDQHPGKKCTRGQPCLIPNITTWECGSLRPFFSLSSTYWQMDFSFSIEIDGLTAKFVFMLLLIFLS